MKIGLHIHSEYSMDAKQTVDAIVSKSILLGFDAIAITDHNTVAGSMAAANMNAPNIKVIIGAEFSTEKGHILALFIDDQIERDCRKIGNVFAFDALVEMVRQQQGLCFLAHPLQSAATVDHAFIASLDGFELINARINSSHKNRKADQLSEMLKTAYPDKILIGGSDAHTMAELKSAFITSEQTDIKEALLNIDSIYFRKSSMTLIRFNNVLNNKKKHLKFYFRQGLLMIFGLLYDLNTKIKGDSYEIIRVRKEAQ